MKLRPLFCFPDISTKDKLRWFEQNKTMATLDFIQGGFFYWSALKMTKCQPLKEFSELVLPKKD